MSPLPAAIWELEWDSLVPKFFACPIDEVWPLLPTERPSSRTKDGIVAGGHVVALSTLADPEILTERSWPRSSTNCDGPDSSKSASVNLDQTS